MKADAISNMLDKFRDIETKFIKLNTLGTNIKNDLSDLDELLRKELKKARFEEAHHV